MLATAGVSDDHVTRVATVSPPLVITVAKSWSWNPTGSAGSFAARPLNRKAYRTGAAGPTPLLQAPKFAFAGGCQVPSAPRCSDQPMGVAPDSATPMSVDASPLAGPPLPVNAPS